MILAAVAVDGGTVLPTALFSDKGATSPGGRTIGTTVHGERVLLPDGLGPANVTIAAGSIARVVRGRSAADARPLPAGTILAPGFIDVQVNGGGGVLFNDAPTAETLRTMAGAHRAGGTTGMLPTLITDAPGLMEAAAGAVREVRAAPGSGILGLHLEGPFISPARPGVHAARFIRTMMRADRDALIAIARSGDVGALLITLAPEMVDLDDLGVLASAGAVLSAGHTEASAARIEAARRAGLRGFTHLWNAMPPLAGRAPGPVGACLADREAWCGVIADGLHVDPVNLGLTLRCKAGRLFLVTDAMPPAGTGMSGFMLQGRQIDRSGGRLVTQDGTLTGADLLMIDAVRGMMSHADASLEEALRMASAMPAAFLGLERRGRIETGQHADLVLLSDNLVVLDTAVDGKWTGAWTDTVT